MSLQDPTLELQKIFAAVLTAAATEAANRIYDAVPSKPVFPYIRMGTVQVLSEHIESFAGAEVYFTVDAWSQKNGRVEIRRLAKQIVAALDDADLSNEQLAVNSCELDDVQYIDDPDGKTSHAAITFHILTD